MPTRHARFVLASLLCAAALAGPTACADEGTSSGSCDPNPTDATQYVIVGFWKTTDCSGDPIITNAFPVSPTAPCYCWPGNSGENSADTFSCDATAQTFTYTQYNSLTCGAGDTSPTLKTVYSTECRQDTPPTLYTRIVDFGACAN